MDNQAGIAIAYNPKLHAKTKHTFSVATSSSASSSSRSAYRPPCFVKTTDNWADFFTKPLKPKHFTAMRNAIINIDIIVVNDLVSQH